MREQVAGGETKQDLPDLLNEILADLQSALSNARNMPAKKLLRERIDRVRRAIEAATPASSSPQSGRTLDANRKSRLIDA